MESMSGHGLGAPIICLLTIYSGRDDFICIAGANGALTAWRNTLGNDPRQPNVRIFGFLNAFYFIHPLNTLC